MIVITTTIMITAIIIEPSTDRASGRTMTPKVSIDPASQLPVGPLVDTSPAREPNAVVLKGRFGRIEKLDPTRHCADLWLSLRDHDQVWTYMPYGPFADREAFLLWLKTRAGITDPFSYVVIDADGHACGIIALMAFRAEMRVIEVGNVLLSTELQRTALATEAQYLLARYVFETLGYRRYEWKCDSRNAASRRAALRLGFNFEGLSKQHMIIKGRNRDTAWYAMLDAEWPSRKLAFERWLSPDNFDADGRQKARLADETRPMLPPKTAPAGD
jgi:RimJ/RimL family protein N-acetyltransferase